MKVKFLPR